MASEPTVTVKAVELRAQLLRIRTRQDRTADVTLNVGEGFAEQVKELFGWLMDEVEMVIINEPKDLIELDENAKQAGQSAEKRTTRLGRGRA